MIIAAKAAISSAEEVVRLAITESGAAYVNYSYDGVTWTRSPQIVSGGSMGAAGYFDNNWIFGTRYNSSSGERGEIWTTQDFTSFTKQTSPFENIYGGLEDFTADNSTALMVGYRGPSDFKTGACYATVYDTWTSQATGLTGTTLALCATTDGSGTWLLGTEGSSGSNCYSSTDLTSGFTSRTVGFNNIKGVATDGTTWIAAGASGNLRSSTNLSTWTSRTSQFSTTSIESAAYGNGLFVIVGASGKISTSPDGTTWTARTSGVATALYGVEWSQALGKFFACGASGKVLSSSDGITWASTTTPVAATLWNVGVR